MLNHSIFFFYLRADYLIKDYETLGNYMYLMESLIVHIMEALIVLASHRYVLSPLLHLYLCLKGSLFNS